jgi:vacuolar-type H+-ATPase subunit I/STV1
MKKVFKQAGLLVASLLMVGGLAVVPVSAQHGSDDDSSGSTSSGSGSSGSSSTGSTSSDDSDDQVATTGTGTETDTENHTIAATDDSSRQSGKLRTKADKLLSDLRQKGKEHSENARQKACVARQKGIDRRTTAYANAAERHLTAFNQIFAKVQAFHDKKQLNVTNYDALVAAATAKQTAAQSAADALKALNVTVDCTQSDPATTVATIKTAVKDARTALKEYRTAIKNLVVALKGASTAQDKTTTDDSSTTTGGDQ